MNVRITIGMGILLVSLACAGLAADAPKVTADAATDAPPAPVAVAAESPKVNLDAKDTPFADAMADIGKQAGVQIVCDSDIKKTVTGQFSSMDIEKLMDTLTKVNSLVWQKLYVPVPDKDKQPTVAEIKARAAAVAAVSGGPIVVCDSAGKQKVFVEQESSAPSVDPEKLGLKVVYLISKPAVAKDAKKDTGLAAQLQALETQRMQLLAKMTPEERVNANEQEMRSMMDMDPSTRQQMMIDQFTAQRAMRQDPQYQQMMRDTMQTMRDQGLMPAGGFRGGGGGRAGGQ